MGNYGNKKASGNLSLKFHLMNIKRWQVLKHVLDEKPQGWKRKSQEAFYILEILSQNWVDNRKEKKNIYERGEGDVLQTVYKDSLEILFIWNLNW